MRYRSLGASGVEVSVIGFGCGPRARLMVGDDEALQLEVVALALELGITYFDTAGAYGDGRSERNLGRAIRTLGAEPVISTKVSIQDDELGDPRSAVLRRFDEGRNRLGVDVIDILMLHNRVFHEPKGEYAVGAQLSLTDVFAPNGVVAAFAELMQSGCVRVVGFTAYGGDVSAIAELIDCGVFGAINASFSAVNPSALVSVPETFQGADHGGVAARAAIAGLGVMAIQVLGRGELIGDGSRAASYLSSPDPDEALTSLATRYVLSKPEVSTAILGISVPAHVRDAVSAVEKGVLSAAMCASMERRAGAHAS
jgi:aryl-alcohol dehydrogenase-like predicted oxidoreductase